MLFLEPGGTCVERAAYPELQLLLGPTSGPAGKGPELSPPPSTSREPRESESKGALNGSPLVSLSKGSGISGAEMHPTVVHARKFPGQLGNCFQNGNTSGFSGPGGPWSSAGASKLRLVAPAGPPRLHK